MANKDHYETLGVARTASDADIKRAFRKLAKKYHPDVAKDDPKSADRFKEVASAYDVLGDREKRTKYDLMLRLGAVGGSSRTGDGPFSSGFGGFRPSSTGGRPGSRAGSSTGAAQDIPPGFEGFGDLFGDLFKDGTRRPRGRRPDRGKDTELSVVLSLRDAIRGARPTVEVGGWRSCPDCSGTGSAMARPKGPCPDCGGTGRKAAKGPVPFSRTCERCSGTGQAVLLPCSACDGKGARQVSERLRVTVPPNVQAGDRIRVRGKGQAGRNGGAPGDLYLLVTLEDDPTFKIEGRNLLSVVRVHALNAMLGTTVEVETLNGKASMKIPPGTQGGQRFRLKGKGLPAPKDGEEPGDLYVTVQIDVPGNLDEEARTLVRQLKERLGVG